MMNVQNIQTVSRLHKDNNHPFMRSAVLRISLIITTKSIIIIISSTSISISISSSISSGISSISISISISISSSISSTNSSNSNSSSSSVFEIGQDQSRDFGFSVSNRHRRPVINC